MTLRRRLVLSLLLWCGALAWALAPHSWTGATLWHRGDHGIDVVDLPGIAVALIGEVLLFGPPLWRRRPWHRPA